MDYSGLTTLELTSTSNFLNQVDLLLSDEVGRLPDGFGDMLVEFVAMDEVERATLLSEMSATANFRAYAESLGNGDMAPALMQVAKDMVEMTPIELKSVERGGLVNLTTVAGKKLSVL